MEAAIQAVFGVIGELMANGKELEAKNIYKRMLMEAQGIELPAFEDIVAQQLGPSAMEGVTTDPALEAAQYDALGALGEVGQDGLAAVDEAALNRIANQVSRRSRGAQAGIEADMAARGLAGSGIDYGARLQDSSDANMRISEAGQNIGADALQRRIQALGMRGELGGKIRGQSFDEKSKKADATDTINRINAGMRERAQYHNANLPQQRFQNRLAKLGAQANPSMAQAGFHQGQGESQRGLWAGLGAAGSRMAQQDGGQKTTQYDSESEPEEDEYWKNDDNEDEKDY